MSRHYDVTLPSDKSSLKSLRAFLGSVLAGICEEPEPLILAVDEACSNVIKYRSQSIDDGMIHVSVEVADDALRFRVGRFCKSQDLHKIKPRDLRDVRPGGLGTSFIGQIMDRVDYVEEEGTPGCLALLLEKKVSS